MKDTPVIPDSDFEQSLNRLLVVASAFLLKAQELQYDKQPEHADVVWKALHQGGRLAVRVEIGEPAASLDAGVILGGQWFSFLRWPAPQVQPIPNATVN